MANVGLSEFSTRFDSTSTELAIPLNLMSTLAMLRRNLVQDKGKPPCTLMYYTSMTVETTNPQGNTITCKEEERSFFSVPYWPQDVSTEIEAKTGRLLIFKQKNIVHEGCKILSGHKFILQGMILYTPEEGKKSLPLNNFFVVVNQTETNKDPIAVLKSMRSTSTIKESDDETEYDKLVRMIKAGHQPQALERFILIAGIPQSEVDRVTAQIVADAEAAKNDTKSQEPHSNEVTAFTYSDSSNFTHCRYYKMLKIGITPEQVFHSMTLVSKIPQESARSYLNGLLERFEQNQNTAVEV